MHASLPVKNVQFTKTLNNFLSFLELLGEHTRTKSPATWNNDAITSWNFLQKKDFRKNMYLYLVSFLKFQSVYKKEEIIFVCFWMYLCMCVFGCVCVCMCVCICLFCLSVLKRYSLINSSIRISFQSPNFSLMPLLKWKTSVEKGVLHTKQVSVTRIGC